MCLWLFALIFCIKSTWDVCWTWLDRANWKMFHQPPLLSTQCTCFHRVVTSTGFQHIWCVLHHVAMCYTLSNVFPLDNVSSSCWSCCTSCTLCLCVACPLKCYVAGAPLLGRCILFAERLLPGGVWSQFVFIHMGPGNTLWGVWRERREKGVWQWPLFISTAASHRWLSALPHSDGQVLKL